MIPLPPSFTASTTQVAAALFSDWGGYITLIVGVLLAVTAITLLIGSFHK